MSLSSPFIHRPVATVLLTAAIALAGAVAFKLLPVSPLPQIDFPTISVQANLPGASPEIMASSVATPLERQLGHIAGVTEMTSASYLGSTSVTLQFDLNRDIDAAARDVQAAINAARGYLPANLPNNPTYRKVNPADAPIMIVALTSDVYDQGKLYDAASTVLQQKLSQIQGVGQVVVGGSSLPAVRVDVNPTQLNATGLGLEDVRNMLSQQNANLAKGQLANNTTTADLAVNDQLLKAADYRPLIVGYSNGAAIRLSDIANVQDSVENLRSAGLANGKPCALVIIFRQPGANIIDTVDSVRAALPQLKASIPSAIDLTVVMDQTTTIRASVRDVERTLIISIGLVIMVVFVFLRNPRVTIIPAVVVPVSLIGTFGVMYLCHYSLDNLSLMALTISTGFVVDDAIVVIENVTRHLEQGMRPMQAALLGAKEIGFTVLSISISLIAVFTPLLLMGGIVGRLFREFAVTLSVAILVSLVVSLTTTPMICSRLLKAKEAEHHGRLYRLSERFFAWLLSLYERNLTWVLRHPAPVLLVLLITIGVNFYLLMIVPKGFFPQQDTGRLAGGIQGAQDSSFTAMKQRMVRFVDIVKSDPAVANVVAFTGSGGGTTTNTGRMFISLKPLEERKVSADEIIRRLRRQLATVEGASLFLQATQDLRVGGRGGNAQYQYTIQSENLDDLVKWGPVLMQQLRKVAALTDVNSDQQNSGLQASLDYDRATAERLGITPQAIDATLYDAFGQRQVSTMYTQLNQYHVVMEVEPRYWQSPEGLKEIYLHSSSGGVVPLSAVAHYEPATAPLAVNHQGQFPAVTFSFNLAPGVALSDAVRAINQTEQSIGMPGTIHGSFAGTAQAFQTSLASEPLLIVAALLAVYIVLGILYESYIHPITILSTLPSAGVGAVLALLLTRMDLSLIALIGIILLIGIVKKNAIMMIDFALAAERGEGKSSRDAIFQACMLRFRPIMMTTMAALLGALPLALGTGTGSELRRPLGISIIGGLLVSQMLTLFTTPVVYLYLDRVRAFFAHKAKMGRPRSAAPSVEFTMRNQFQILGVSLLGVMLFKSCDKAPKYAKPPVATPAAYKEIAPDAFKETNDWKFARPSDGVIRGKWWEMFNDPQLNSLEEQLSVANQNIALADANFRAARALVKESRSQYFPTVTTSPSIIVSRQSGAATHSNVSPGRQSVNYTLPFDATWEPDFWGRIRNSVVASASEAQASAADLQNVRLSVEAELAFDYYQLRSLDAEKRLLDTTIEAYQQQLELTRVRFQTGIASDEDVAQAETQLKTTQAQATDLGIARAQLEHAIALLTGQPASTFSLPAAPLDAQPPAVPVGLPSQLLERRPDIAAAERRVAEANAEIGVTKAAFFPSLVLGATGGLESTSIASWFTWPARFFSLGPTLTQTLFDKGRRAAATEAARAQYDATVASYRQTVLTSFQEVEDNVAALRILSRELDEQNDAVASAQRALSLSTERYKSGIDSYLNVITAQTTLLNNQRVAVNLQAQQMTASVELIKALGGGWSNSELPTQKQLTK